MLSEVQKFERNWKKLVSVAIIVTPPSGFYKCFLYKSKKSTGHISTETDTEHLIETTIYAYLHTLCNLDDFNPVIRSANTRDKVIICVFKFDKKYLFQMRQFIKAIGNLYNSKSNIISIDYEKHYSNVLKNHKIDLLCV